MRRREQEKSGNFIVGSILNRKFINNEKYYFVSWRDFNSSFNSWEPSKSLQKVKDLLLKYDKENPLKVKSDQELKSVNKPKSKVKSNHKKSNLILKKPKKSKSVSVNNIVNTGHEVSDTNQDFKTTDVILKPICILKLDIYLDGKLYALVKWENSTISTINYEFIKCNYPSLLIDFYESRIVFPYENKGTAIFKNKHKVNNLTNQT